MPIDEHDEVKRVGTFGVEKRRLTGDKLAPVRKAWTAFGPPILFGLVIIAIALYIIFARG